MQRTTENDVSCRCAGALNINTQSKREVSGCARSVFAGFGLVKGIRAEQRAEESPLHCPSDVTLRHK